MSTHAEFLKNGWIFSYEPATRFIGANHPQGGKQSVAEVVHPFEPDELGEVMARALRGETTRSALWPLADADERRGGWTISVAFLKAISKSAETHGEDVSLEGVEAVLLAAQAHALLAPNAEVSGGSPIGEASRLTAVLDGKE